MRSQQKRFFLVPDLFFKEHQRAVGLECAFATRSSAWLIAALRKPVSTG
jgi:hypothetical protein